MTYDAIVVGARCAGSPTAMLLARKGYRVLLVDKATFPSDTVSGHFILPTGVAQLAQWGVLDRVVDAASCPPVRSWRFDVGPFALTGTPAATDDAAVACYGPRRTALDTVLVHAAAEAHVDVREAFAVQELVIDNDAVSGVRGRAAGGPTVTETARIVIGADGMRSIVARSVQAEVYESYPRLACYYYAYWSDLPTESLELYPRDGLIVGVFPTTHDTSMVFVGRPVDQFDTVRADVEGSYRQAVASIPGLADRLRTASRVDRFHASGDLPNFCRKPFGAGWALVGDAGYHKDPCLPLGISDAFRDAERLANAVDAGLAGRQPMADALAQYERDRNTAAMPSYALTRQLASLQAPPPQMQQLFGALLDNQSETNNFFGALAGTVPIPDFFAPENLGRIISGATAAAV